MKKILLILLCLPLLTLAQQTYVPDDNFEAYLEANGMGNGIANDNYVTTANINTAGSLYVDSQNISDLTGIEDFIALAALTCNDNQLTTLDLCNNTSLSYLECWGNQLTTLDFSQNPHLEFLYCQNNLIYELDLSYQDIQYLDCTNNQINDLTIESDSLKELFCGNNPLFLFDATNHPNLEMLAIFNTSLFNIDLSQNLYLWFLSIGSNTDLWSLDLSNNYLLEHLDLYSNSLSNLDMRNGNNQNISYFVTWNCWNSQFLECISVDDSIYSSNNWTSIDSWHYFSNNCNPLAIQEHSINKELLKITDLLGRETKQTNQPLFYLYEDGTVEKRIVIE